MTTNLFVKCIFTVLMTIFIVGSHTLAAQEIEQFGETQLTEIAPIVNSQLLSSELLSSDQPLPVNDRILALLETSYDDSVNVDALFLKIEAISEHFNIAEQYLILMIRGSIENNKGEYQKAINWLNQALAMEEKMSKTQLFSPEFSKIHFILADSFAATDQYKLAFEQKKRYMEKYRDYRKQLREARLDKLNKKYETDLKVQENELLESQNELKSLQLKEAEIQTQTQRRNITILIVTAIIFLILLIRQLKIRSILKVLTKTDSLTGLYNRRTLFSRGEHLIKMAIKDSSPLSVILIDIDHFKSINDNFGHSVGDKTIAEVAKLGRETMRSKDVFARLGGEEFAAILPETCIDEAKAIAERFREKVEQLVLKNHEISRVTISAGVACLTEEFADFDALLNAADNAMYQAKDAGRNAVRSYCRQ